MADTLDREELKRRIVQAFEDSVPPGDDHISRCACASCGEVAYSFAGKTWKDLSLTTIYWERGELGIFTPEAFAYYLPAFMLACVDHFDEVDTLPENLLSLLTVPRKEDGYDESWIEYYRRRAEALNREQSKAFRNLLLFLGEQYPVDHGAECDEALANWWDQFG